MPDFTFDDLQAFIREQLPQGTNGLADTIRATHARQIAEAADICDRIDAMNAAKAKRQREVEDAILRVADAATPLPAAAPGKAPRLCVEADGDGAIAILDGKRFSLRGTDDGKFLQALLERNGKPMLANVLAGKMERPDRIYKRLPKPIQELVKRPSRKGGREGYRIEL
ncbi:hypothetical protein RAS1_37870 [Phycisphaerae bacterium RAS1]|nr:hypothetical protein RAS1_37870 [Phycisphaerae bacterium RAS1]